MKKFLIIPLTDNNYKITSGWFYNKKDFISQKLISNRHFAIDFELPKKSTVVAAASGWAVSSYHHFLIKYPKDGRKFIRYKGSLIGSGQGKFVIIFHPKQNVFTQYGHLGLINIKIPFYKPTKKRGIVSPPIQKFLPNFFNKRNSVWIKAGEKIGSLGDSGLIGGWSKPHLHFEIYKYRTKEGKKPEDSYIDPFDIYNISKYYPWPNHPKPAGRKSLWLSLP